MIPEDEQKNVELMLAKWLAKLREEKGLSQEALGLQIGKSQSDVAKIESGRKKVTVLEVLRWLRALDLPLGKLVDGLGPMYNTISKKRSLWDKNEH